MLNLHVLVGCVLGGWALLFFVFYHALEGVTTQGKRVWVMIAFLYGILSLTVPALEIYVLGLAK